MAIKAANRDIINVFVCKCELENVLLGQIIADFLYITMRNFMACLCFEATKKGHCFFFVLDSPVLYSASTRCRGKHHKADAN
ncbi:hypothetical protein M378DRAFT_169611 [Amanita muscaria Koide BX008]|uniref:Uncharacterized protein n=1 Tax=Amanita muscaria (strain Koide BX008) TaxID=946122 RepID=A0A0C2WD00_AMAMK|nr:hypothetical protein M378DRAFT_169611 [Amanita muscaria Koide BX008]